MTPTPPESGPRLAVVTGAAGFVGRHLVAGLADRGWTVRAVDLPGMVPPAHGDRVEWIEGDIRQGARFDAVLEGADTVFHLASAHLQVGASVEWYRSVNVDAMGPLVRACAAAGVRRLVHTSSVGIYGHVPAPPADEDSPKNPGNLYEKTKLEGEELAMREAEG